MTFAHTLALKSCRNTFRVFKGKIDFLAANRLYSTAVHRRALENRLAPRRYSTEIIPSKIAHAIQEENSRTSSTHTTPSAAQALGLSPNPSSNEMAPPRRPANAGAKPGKPVSTEPRPSASYVLLSSNHMHRAFPHVHPLSQIIMTWDW